MKFTARYAILLLVLLLVPGAASAQNITSPSDPLFDQQWALPHVGASCAWGYTTGSSNVSVAVVDSGVDMGHPDLVDRLRTDGRDFVDGDDDPRDENGHGTNVAGIIAATLDNAEGIAGLAPGVKILPVRVMDAEGFGSDRAIARGIHFAADQGAQVINLSLGATLTIGAETESREVSSAIRYAQSRGALVVVAAGNDFVPLPNAIVGDNPDVLVVAATDQRDRKAAFSNSGPWIGVTAPGVHILSTMPTYDVYLTSDKLPRDERFQKNYDYMTGTSQAAPFVSALAALLFSAHPDWSAQQVAQAIKEHAADISEQNQSLWARGYLGRGRIDACAALGGPPAEQPNAPPAATPVARPSQSATELPTQPRPTRVPQQPFERPPVAVVPEQPDRAAGSDLLIVLGALVCIGLLMLVVLVGIARRLLRRSRPDASAARPAPPQARATPVPAPAPAPAPTVQGWGALTVVGGVAQPRSYPLIGAESVVGRAPECTVVLTGDETVSRRHALVRNDGQQVTIEDLGSTHGTYLHGQRLSGPALVRRGDIVQIGQTLLRFD